MGSKNRKTADFAAADAFKSFFNPHVAALRRALGAFGLSVQDESEDVPGIGFDLHMAPLDEADRERGYASADVTINAASDAGREIKIVLWFVRFRTDTPWLLITRNGYLDWLLLGDGDATQGIPPGLHMAIKQLFPGTLEHYDWYETRGRQGH